MRTTNIINFLIDDNNYESYLEIGTENPKNNFNLINVSKKESVDPYLEKGYHSEEAIQKFKKEVTYCMTSDEFFAQNKKLYDIIFIDGDHSCEQSAKDIINGLNTINKNGCLVIHDSMPEFFELTQIENYKKALPYHGEVWKPVYALINDIKHHLTIKTIYHNLWSTCTIIKKDSNNPDNFLTIDYFLNTIRELNLDYFENYKLNKMNAVYSLNDLKCDKVSYFTSLYNTDKRYLQELYVSLIKQTNKNWEWVIVDDSPTDKLYTELFTDPNIDKRVKYNRFKFQSDGIIGESKYRAAMLCNGTLLAELDHDDILMPTMTQELLDNIDYDFISTNSTYLNISYNENSDKYILKKLEKYPEGFAMGYGKYRNTVIDFPLGEYELYDEMGKPSKYINECINPPINPKTLRHITGVPNHIRVWKKDFYMKIGGHNRTMPHCDDYELVVRTFLNGGSYKHIDKLLYIQRWHPENTTDKRRGDIQLYVKSIVVSLEKELNDYFNKNGGDWCQEYLDKNFNGLGLIEFKDGNQSLNCVMVPNKEHIEKDKKFLKEKIIEAFKNNGVELNPISLEYLSSLDFKYTEKIIKSTK